jgi:hypothetical protein
MAVDTTLRYLKLDFASHKDALLQRVRARWPRAWNDFLNNSFGIVLVDLVAWATSTLAFTINRVAGESYVGTMTLRESAVRLGANFGYQLRSPSPAVVACEATLTTVQTATVTIAAGTLLRTSDESSIPFEVSEDYTIEAGDLTPKLTVAQIAPGLAGANTIAALVTVTADSVNADLTDSSVDLTQFVQAGQTFTETGETDEYSIYSIEAAPGAVSNNRLVLAQPWAGETGTISATIYDKRILIVQGQTITDTFSTPITVSPSYGVRTSRTPVIDGSVTVTVNGEEWTEETSLAGSSGEDQVYRVQTFPTGETVVSFGDNSFGQQIPTEAIVVVTYRVGGGVAGNIGTNAIETSITGLVASTSSPVTVNIANTTSGGQGGRDAETLEEARTNIPYFVRTNDRAVTLDDYQTIASQFVSPQFGSVAFARATVRTENALLEGNTVSLYAWTTGPDGLVALSPQLKLALQAYVQTKAVGTDYVQILDGEARPVPISLRFKTLSGYSVVDTQRLIEDTVTATITALRPGQPVLWSNLVRSLDEVLGVDTVNMATPLADLNTSSTIELFTVPQASFVYDLDRTGVGSPVTSVVDGTTISLYEAQLPVFPVEAWSIRLFLGSNELTVVPDLKPGYAMLLGSNLSVNETQDSDRTYTYRSRVNLLTGKVSLWLVGAPGDLTMKLVPVAGYGQERSLNVYVGYTGDNSQSKRREVRSAIRSWSNGLSIGGTLYASPLSGITSSKSNVEDVVLSINGVDSVTRVALDTPASTADRISALDEELVKISNIYVNNQLD